jgi:mycothiol system anti-sigma-R factor
MTSGLPHFTSCADVLARVYEFIDNELAEADCAHIKQHLDECGPCLREFGLEQLVKDVVSRACGRETPPEDLRSKVMFRIQQVQVEITTAEVKTPTAGPPVGGLGAGPAGSPAW